MKDDAFILRTLSLAARARGMTSPNPMVGALLVKNGRIIAEGYHRKAGTAHAEAIAIENAGDKVRGATLYVSLEPCCHTDKRTPPCTEKIISSGIRKVVIATTDPNPKVSGKGIAALEKAGIRVTAGIQEKKARELNEYYFKFITTGTPFVILKVAMTLDGKIATPDGESRWITGEKARALVHSLRGSVDAVLTGIGTVKADNPRLTCRTGEDRDPIRIIIDPDLKINLNSNVLSTPPDTIIVTRKGNRQSTHNNPEEGAGKHRILSERGVLLIEYKGEKADLNWLLQKLGERSITSILIEGGSSLNSYCLEHGIVDKVMFFIAPKIIGGRESFPAVGGKAFRRLHDAHFVRDIRIKRVAEDILVEGYIQK